MESTSNDKTTSIVVGVIITLILIGATLTIILFLKKYKRNHEVLDQELVTTRADTNSSSN